jgi:hypothetical protein
MAATATVVIATGSAFASGHALKWKKCGTLALKGGRYQVAVDTGGKVSCSVARRWVPALQKKAARTGAFNGPTGWKCVSLHVQSKAKGGVLAECAEAKSVTAHAKAYFIWLPADVPLPTT